MNEKGKQFDLFRKPPIDNTVVQPLKSLNTVVGPLKKDAPHEPTDEDLAAMISESENDGKPVNLIKPGDNKKAFEEFKKSWRKLLGEPGSQTDLPLK
jgi:hypothetical protein